MKIRTTRFYNKNVNYYDSCRQMLPDTAAEWEISKCETKKIFESFELFDPNNKYQKEIDALYDEAEECLSKKYNIRLNISADFIIHSHTSSYEKMEEFIKKQEKSKKKNE